MDKDNLKQAILYSYMAGLIDSEGSISISRSIRKDKLHWKPAYNGFISIGNTAKIMIDLMIENFGGTYTIECVPNRKPMYRWITRSSNKVISILETLLPYLKVKSRQAEIVINFCKSKKTYGFQRNKGLPKKEIQKREGLFRKVRELNAAGAAATTKREDNREIETIV